MGRVRVGPITLQAFLLTLMGVLLILPIVLAVGDGFYHEKRFSLEWLVRTLKDRRFVGQLTSGLLLACCTTLLALLIALPPAILRGRCRFAGSGVLSMLMLVPMILPPFVGALSMRHLLGQFGAINLLLDKIGILDFSRSLPPDYLGSGFAGVAILQALHLFPILYLNASAALASVDPAYAQAARNLGAGPWAAFRHVTLPLIRPGLFAGATIVFIWSFTDIGTPAMLGYNELAPVTIFKELARSETTPTVYALVFVLLSGSVSLYVLGKFLFGRESQASMTKASQSVSLRPLGLTGTLGAWALFGAIIFAALLPHVGVVLTAFSSRWVNTVLPSAWTLDHLRFVLIRPETLNSITNSLYYSGISTAADLILGLAAAWLIVRTRVRGRTLLDALVMLPLAVPGLIVAAGYVAMTANDIHVLGVTIPLRSISPAGKFTFVLLIVAYTVRRLPFAVRGISAGLQQVPTELEEAARNLGATPTRTLGRITLPLILANIIAAGVLTFAFAMLEVSDSLILAQRQEVFPITREIYQQATSGSTDAANIASALGVYGMLLLGGTLALASALMGKRLGAIFRA
jgi:iron(III) transport system permease protein